MTGFYPTRIYNQTHEPQTAKLILQSSVLAPKLLTFDSKDKVTEPERDSGFSICSWACITLSRCHKGNQPTKQPIPHLQSDIIAPLLSQGLVHGQTLQYSANVSGTRKLRGFHTISTSGTASADQ